MIPTSILFIALILLAYSQPASAWTKRGTVYTTDGSEAEVQAALNHASPNDTVVVPSGVHRWKRVEVSTPVTLMGMGNGPLPESSTIILDDNDPNDGNAQLLNLQTASGRSYRVTNMRWKMGSDTGNKGRAHIRVGGNSHSIRIDNHYFDDIFTSPVVRFNDSSVGSFDTNTFYVKNGSPTLTWGFHSTWPNGNGVWGDGSWTDPVTYGDGLAWYIEDNTLVNESGNRVAFSDTYGGCRLVYRYNVLNDANFPTHGTGDGSGRSRGPRRLEFYKNRITLSSGFETNSCHVRGGPGLFFANHHVDGLKGITFHHYRFDKPHGKFDFIDGIVPWDQPYLNDSEASPGGPGDGVFDAGVASEGTGGVNEWTDSLGYTSDYYILRDTSKNWIPDQWKGYTLRAWVTDEDAAIRRLDHPTGLAYPDGTLGTVIHGNDETTLFLKGDNQPIYAIVRVSPGRPYEIRRVRYALDQVGMGRSGDITDKSAFPRAENVNQEFDGFYVWSNTFTDPRAINGVGEPGTDPDIHFFNELASYDGSSGMGVGLLKDRPLHPSLRYTAYYATDAVHEDRAPGVLYRWNGEAWDYWWSQYTYPHPLRASGGQPTFPSPPDSLRTTD